jgi:hypothetical protein
VGHQRILEQVDCDWGQAELSSDDL